MIEPTWTSQDGRVVLYCGDCMDVLPTLAAGSVDAVVTDPPYGIGYSHGGGNNKGKWTSKFPGIKIHGDNKQFDPTPWLKWPCLLFGANHYAKRLPEIGQWLAWDKSLGKGPNDSFTDCEFMWTNRLRTPRNIARVLWKGSLSVEKQYNGSNIIREHPSMKPQELMEWCLALFPTANTILDPFMGSGSTAVAVIKKDLKFIGIEIEKKWFEIARARIERAIENKANTMPLEFETEPVAGQGDIFAEEKP